MDHVAAYPSVRFADLPAEFKRRRMDLSDAVEFKSLPTEIKADRKKRTVELWIASYNNVDLGGDLILPGAAKKSIAADHPRKLVKFFWNHELALGQPTRVEEHSDGILMEAKVTDEPYFDRYLAQIADGTASHGSIGWKALDVERISAQEAKARYGVDPAGHRTIRLLKQIKVFEGSAVLWPMNERAEVVGVKGTSMSVETKDLWDLAAVLECMARIRHLTASEWAQLTEEEVAIALDLLEQMTSTEKCLRAGLETKTQKPSDSPESGMKRLRETLASRFQSITTH